MNKKLITLIAMVAIVSSFAMAAVGQFVNDTQAEGLGLYAVTANPEGTTVVVDADNVDFLFQLEAQDTEGSGDWESADTYEVFNSAWDVRSTFTAPFRVRAISGTNNEAQGVKLTFTIGALTRLVETGDLGGTHEASIGTIVGLTSGVNFTSHTVVSPLIHSFYTVPNYYYGQSSSEIADSLTFGIQYVGDTVAPAGRYKSAITLAYAIL